MQMAVSTQPTVSLIAGLSILVVPRLRNDIVAIYRIVIGVLGLLHREAHIPCSAAAAFTIGENEINNHKRRTCKR
jgi:hypothetical protein